MIYDEIQEEIKAAMKAKDNLRRDCLRGIIAEIKNQTVNAGKKLTEDVVLNVLRKAAKTRNDSIAQFTAANRLDLAQKEHEELVCIEKYLPQMLNEDDTKQALMQILEKVEAVKKNFGLIMKQLPKEVDKKIASRLLNALVK